MTMTAITLKRNHVMPEGAAALAETLAENTYLEECDLSSNHISSRGINSIAKAIELGSSVHTLTLERNELLDIDATELCRVLAVST